MFSKYMKKCQIYGYTGYQKKQVMIDLAGSEKPVDATWGCKKSKEIIGQNRSWKIKKEEKGKEKAMKYQMQELLSRIGTDREKGQTLN